MNDDTLEGGVEGGEIEPASGAHIARWDTGLRILLTVLFAVIWGVLETVLGLVVIFGLLWALITEQAPPARVRDFANRLVTYGYRIGRYVVHTESRVPFPFSEFPAPLEPPQDLGRDEATEVRELVDRNYDRRRDEDLEDDLD